MHPTITTIRSDHDGDFDNIAFDDISKINGYEHNFLAPETL